MKLGDFEEIEREEWVPDAHAHRLFKTCDVEPGGDEISGRRLLMWNDDVEISLCRPDAQMDYFFRNGEGDEVIFVHEGSGTLETNFGELPYKEGDYVVIPRGTTYRFRAEGDQRYLVFESPGLIEIPRRYRNQYGQLLEHAPYYHRDIHPPTELQTHREQGEFQVKVRIRDGYQTYLLDYHPFDVVGWDGYVYPWTFSIHDFEPITGRIHQPPPSHQTFQGRNFVICSFCPRKLDFDPLAIPIPYHHSNLKSEEMIYYVSGNFGSREGHRGRLDHAASVRDPARPAARAWRRSRSASRDARAGRDVRHLPPAAPDEARQGARRRQVRHSWFEEPDAPRSGGRRRGSRRRNLALLASPTSAAESPSRPRSTAVAAATSGRTRSLSSLLTASRSVSPQAAASPPPMRSVPGSHGATSAAAAKPIAWWASATTSGGKSLGSAAGRVAPGEGAPTAVGLGATAAAAGAGETSVAEAQVPDFSW